MLVINGVEMEFKMGDVDFYEKYMENATKMDAVLDEEIPEEEIKKDYKKAAELLRRKCRAIKGFFKEMFGTDAAEAVCGADENVEMCCDAYNAMAEEVETVSNRIAGKIKAMTGVAEQA